MAEEESVKVAVRVRPFNGREKDRNAECIVEMKGNTTYLTDPEDKNGEPRKFAFDHSYWSHDGCKKMPDGFFGADSSHKNGKIFCDQKRIFDDLGVGVLNNAWEGYNSTLFAYGQTGSGKSWSVVGYGINKGIVPQFCDTLFKQIDAKKGPDAQFEVMFSMLEIYMEEVRDLLNPKSGSNLKVRQHPKRGFYAQGLKATPVDSYQEIEQKMEEGTTNRTVASTAMNATSSRAHTIVGITFVQKFKNAAGEETAKTSIVNLVDLAGSERAENTGATGDRLKEGAAINQSLSSLGNVIAALADQSEGKNVRVPYRDSVLTKLLMNALGGNSKTVMIAAISPADINHDETLSTLRYADRAKQIKCKVSVNEDPTEKLIRELQEENDKLKQMLGGGGAVDLPAGTGERGIENSDGMSAAEKKAAQAELAEEYKALVEENEREMEEMRLAYEEKLKNARVEGGETKKQFEEMHEKMKGFAYITNINFDSQLSGHIVHFVDLEKETVGNNRGQPNDIPLIGPSIEEDHAVFYREADTYFLEKTSPTARVLHNGVPLSARVELTHHDRLLFGTTQYFVFVHPKHRDAAKDTSELPTYEEMQQEISASSGFDMNKENKSKDDMILQADVADMLPAVEEANAISAELDKKKKFEMVMVKPESRGELEGRKKIFVRVIDLETQLEWIWPQEMFLNRKYKMQEMFNKFQDGEKWQLNKEEDPFEEDASREIHIGSVKVWLQSLSYMIEAKEQLEIIDYRGEEVGRINIELVPCDAKGKEYSEDDDVFCEPETLVGKDLHFNAKIKNALGLNKRFTEAYAKFLFYDTKEYICTSKGKDTMNPEWNFKKQFDFPGVSQDLVTYLKTSAVMLQIWAKQKMPKDKATVDTKGALRKMAQGMSGNVAAGGGAGTAFSHFVDPQKVKLSLENSTAQKRAQKSEAKLAQIKKFVQVAEDNKAKKIPTQVLKSLLYAPSKDEADKCINWAANKKGAGSDSSSSDSSSSSSSDDEGKKKEKKEKKEKKKEEKKEDKKEEKKKEDKQKKKDDDQKSSTCVLL